MTAPFDFPQCDARNGQCDLCGDLAVVGRVVSVDEQRLTGTVAFAEHQGTVALDLVDVGPGDSVLVHLGFAIERLETA